VEPHHLLLPAKFGESGGVYAVHPLICHMLDTAAVARTIWDDVLPAAQRRAIADALYVTDESAQRWCAFLAGVHDLGKAAPAFLSHEPAKPLWAALPPALRPGPSLKPRDAPHGFVTTLALTELLPDAFGIGKEVAWRLAAISGGHHGILPSRSAVEALKLSATGKSPWRQARRALCDELAARLRLGDVEAPSALSNEAAVVLAGLISVADWIASDDHHFPYLVPDLRSPPDLSALSAYADAAQARAQRALALLHWHAPPPIEGRRSFGELFAGRAPRLLRVRHAREFVDVRVRRRLIDAHVRTSRVGDDGANVIGTGVELDRVHCVTACLIPHDRQLHPRREMCEAKAHVVQQLLGGAHVE
jgi:CRISPR-associated endonuclease/helicase Cas3